MRRPLMIRACSFLFGAVSCYGGFLFIVLPRFEKSLQKQLECCSQAVTEVGHAESRVIPLLGNRHAVE